MRRSALLLSLLLLGCSSLVFRSGRDYFPLARGSFWEYHSGPDTVYVEVSGDSTLGGRNCIVVSVDDVPGFWLKPEPEHEVRQWVREAFQRGGVEYLLEQRYALVYRLPLVNGSGWAEEHDTTLVVLGVDTLRYRHRLEVKVAGLEPVSVPAGRFENCYRLDFTRTVVTVIADSSHTVVSNHSEWLAPGVGLVRRLSADTEIELAEYRIGPDRPGTAARRQ